MGNRLKKINIKLLWKLSVIPTSRHQNTLAIKFSRSIFESIRATGNGPNEGPSLRKFFYEGLTKFTPLQKGRVREDCFGKLCFLTQITRVRVGNWPASAGDFDQGCLLSAEPFSARPSASLTVGKFRGALKTGA